MAEQRQVPASMRVFLAALDGVIEEAVTATVGQMRGAHVVWHREAGTEPTSECHTCLLLGMVEKPEAQPDAVAPDTVG